MIKKFAMFLFAAGLAAGAYAAGSPECYDACSVELSGKPPHALGLHAGRS